MVPGEYLSPIPRATTFHAPMVSGYVTARLYAVGSMPVLPLDVHSTQFTLQNTGTEAITFNVYQTDQRSTSGVRYDLCGAISLVPGGHSVVNASPSGPYLEFKASSPSAPSAGMLKAQLVSKLKWDLLGFEKSEMPEAFNRAGYADVET